MEDAEAGRCRGAAILQRRWRQQASAQGVDAQQQELLEEAAAAAAAAAAGGGGGRGRAAAA